MENKTTKHHWKTHVVIALFLVILSFVGMFVTNFFQSIAWTYWNFMIPMFALLCIILNWLDSAGHHLDGVTLLHEILHWVSILATIYLVSVFVHYGIISHIDAGLFVLTLLALGTFLAGVYINKTFYFISATQALFILATLFFIKYLIIIGVILIIALLIFLFIQYRHARVKNFEDAVDDISKD